ncbi:selenocysteine lyase [mine drainage metagenome]|uniref:Selenocysteine lyase n=1 Tax=mine drainage metagenome TaxID=410659 RepID=T0ZRU1_9ZZZZ
MDEFIAMLTPDVRLAAVTHVSNVLGTVNPLAEIAAACRKRGIPLLVDGSQAVPHMAVDVRALGCDFYAFTGHKMCGPTGTGGLWARREILADMMPFFGGGEMIREVRIEGSTFADPPGRFEAGTPNIAGFAGLGVAVGYLEGIGMQRIAAREQELLAYATARLKQVPGLRIIGEAAHKAAVISFLIEGAHAHDLATLLDLEGVAVRSGHHCAHPLMQFYGVPATAVLHSLSTIPSPKRMRWSRPCTRRAACWHERDACRGRQPVSRAGAGARADAAAPTRVAPLRCRRRWPQRAVWRQHSHRTDAA